LAARTTQHCSPASRVAYTADSLLVVGIGHGLSGKYSCCVWARSEDAVNERSLETAVTQSALFRRSAAPGTQEWFLIDVHGRTQPTNEPSKLNYLLASIIRSFRAQSRTVCTARPLWWALSYIARTHVHAHELIGVETVIAILLSRILVLAHRCL
jgi:hypothetical protein